MLPRRCRRRLLELGGMLVGRRSHVSGSIPTVKDLEVGQGKDALFERPFSIVLRRCPG